MPRRIEFPIIIRVIAICKQLYVFLKYQMHKEWEILRFYNLFLQFKFILYFSCNIKNIFLTTLIMFKAARRHLLNGVMHACDKYVVWPLPYLLSSPPYFVSLLVPKMKNCTFIRKHLSFMWLVASS
jgi:hypothetical protein